LRTVLSVAAGALPAPRQVGVQSGPPGTADRRTNQPVPVGSAP
jgi:hypothetical protein